MALNSFLFLLLFLPFSVLCLSLLRDRYGVGVARAGLLVLSLVFYAWDGVFSSVLLLCSITFNWAIGQALANPAATVKTRKAWLAFALTVNVAVLSTFKYAGAAAVFVGVRWGIDLNMPALGFPLGLSFFTLTQVMYVVDCYERQIARKSWVEHATFVSLFTNVTAGPLLRAKQFYSQIGEIGTGGLRYERATAMSILVCLGLLKKVVLGDSFSKVAAAGYAHLGQLSTLESWLTMFAGTFEIYFDFSGYSDMAFGCAGLLGLSLVRNFNSPFRATTISDFWKRWHISLSQFITTYLYTPILRLMGKATLRTAAIATVLSMVVAGVWHGASWNYVLFGLLHGFALAGYQYWKQRKQKLPKVLALPLTFLFVSLAFVTVSAPDLAGVFAMVNGLAPQANLLGTSTLTASISPSDLRVLVLPTLFGSVIAFAGPTAEDLAVRFRPSLRTEAAIVCMLLIAFMFMSAGGPVEFRYRQF